MSLDYTKRLQELRTLKFMDRIDEPTIPSDSLMNKPRVKSKTPTRNPLEVFQEDAFYKVLDSNIRLKELQNDDV
jgi:hypothetical protein